MIDENIKLALKNIGIETLPDNPQESLVYYGLDSLKTALLVLELERTFKSQINISLFSEEHFANLQSIQNWLNNMDIA